MQIIELFVRGRNAESIHFDLFGDYLNPKFQLGKDFDPKVYEMMSRVRGRVN